MAWADNLFDQAKGQAELTKRAQAIVGLIQGATEQPSFEEARPFLEQACEELQEMLYADQQRSDVMDIRQRAGFTDDDDPFHP